jgi:hypothetical protein
MNAATRPVTLRMTGDRIHLSLFAHDALSVGWPRDHFPEELLHP